MMTLTLPRKDGAIVTFAVNVSTRINGSAALYQVSPAKVTAYDAALQAFADAYQISQDPATRTRAAVLLKDEKRAALVTALKEICYMVDANLAVPNDAKINLGLRPRKQRSRAQVPPKAFLDVEGVTNNSVTVRVHSGEQSGPARPPFTDGMTVVYFVGDVAPTDPAAWSFALSTNKLTATVDLPIELPFGTRVWFAAFFFNTLKESGIASNPVSVRLTRGGETAQAA